MNFSQQFFDISRLLVLLMCLLSGFLLMAEGVATVLFNFESDTRDVTASMVCGVFYLYLTEGWAE